MNGIEALAQNSLLHYWEQRIIGFQFYAKVKKLLRSEGAFHPEKKILDIGCGQGILADWFSEGNYVGIDTDSKSLAFAEGRLTGRTFIRQDAADLSFQNESFDIVVSVGIIHHLNDGEVRHHLREALRVLRKDGRVVVCDTFMPSVKDYLRKWISHLERGKYLRRPEELERCLRECGLSDFKLNRFQTWYSRNYSLVLKKS